jgi:hypothetical protein
VDPTGLAVGGVGAQRSEWRIAMEARHRIQIIAASIAVVALAGGRAAGATEPPPDTDLGRAAQQCLDSGLPDLVGEEHFHFYDDGRSVIANSFDADECMVQALGLPEWVGVVSFVGVLTFGDWSVMRDASQIDVGALAGVGTGNLVIMDSALAPDS